VQPIPCMMGVPRPVPVPFCRRKIRGGAGGRIPRLTTWRTPPGCEARCRGRAYFGQFLLSESGLPLDKLRSLYYNYPRIKSANVV
jgi:hypothetical protein